MKKVSESNINVGDILYVKRFDSNVLVIGKSAGKFVFAKYIYSGFMLATLRNGDYVTFISSTELETKLKDKLLKLTENLIESYNRDGAEETFVTYDELMGKGLSHDEFTK